MLARNPFNYPTMLHLDLFLSWSETSYQNILANDDRNVFFSGYQMRKQDCETNSPTPISNNSKQSDAEACVTKVNNYSRSPVP